MDHEEAGPAMNTGRGWLALVLATLAVIGAGAAERLGPAPLPEAEASGAVSSVWLCPHGGGEGWEGTIEIANPGDVPVEARLHTLSGGGPSAVGVVEVPPHGETVREVPASARGASTAVEIFGGWAAVAWVVRAGGKDGGMGAEPCTSSPAGTWSVVDGDTSQGVHSYLIVMNPFASDAVIDVALYLPDRPPVREADWTDLPVRAERSIALDLGPRALGESIVGAQVIATRGRIAVASLVVRNRGGIRSVLGATADAPRWILPVAGGTGGGTVSLQVPGDAGIRFGGTLLSTSPPQTAGNLTVIRQGGASTVSAPVRTFGPSAVVVQVDGAGVVSAGLREGGPGPDDAATGGTATPGRAWVVLPTALGGAKKPAVVLVNDGDEAVAATLQLLPEGGGSLGDTITVTVEAHGAAGVPRPFLQGDPTAAVLVVAAGDLVALGAGTSGPGGDGWYAMALGVPVPLGVTGLPAPP
ncbi:MAG TPA: hypothetical protein VJM84_04390 [Actinomycetota bacterium]|nr:hypothetical protein [Actinomycetota bacterium]